MPDDSPGRRDADPVDEDLSAGTTWEDFRNARDRFLARLAELSEISRLERAWSLPTRAEPAGASRANSNRKPR